MYAAALCCVCLNACQHCCNRCCKCNRCAKRHTDTTTEPTSAAGYTESSHLCPAFTTAVTLQAAAAIAPSPPHHSCTHAVCCYGFSIVHCQPGRFLGAVDCNTLLAFRAAICNVSDDAAAAAPVVTLRCIHMLRSQLLLLLNLSTAAANESPFHQLKSHSQQPRLCQKAVRTAHHLI